jgi:hypothetical protein
VTVYCPGCTESTAGSAPPVAGAAGALEAADVLARLGSSDEGLAGDEAARRLRTAGPNAVLPGPHRDRETRWFYHAAALLAAAPFVRAPRSQPRRAPPRRPFDTRTRSPPLDGEP